MTLKCCGWQFVFLNKRHAFLWHAISAGPMMHIKKMLISISLDRNLLKNRIKCHACAFKLSPCLSNSRFRQIMHTA